MSLHEILTEELNPWEEGLVATAFLNALSPEKMSVSPEARKKMQLYLGILQTLPWSYAKEICYGVFRKNYVEAK